MRPDSCTPDQIAELAIERITLRSIGPYVGAAELRLRPLTVLCGTNGSGKSTWIDVLRRLHTIARDETCNNLFYDNNPRQEFTTFTRSLNALVHFPEQTAIGRLDSPENFREARSKLLHVDHPNAMSDYGPPGCIGIDCVTRQRVTTPVSQPPIIGVVDNPISTLLSTGQLSAGHKISLRWSWPDLYFLSSGIIDGSGLWHWIELRIDDCWKIRLSRRLDNPESSIVFSMSAGAIEDNPADPTELRPLGTLCNGPEPHYLTADTIHIYPLDFCPLDSSTLTQLGRNFLRNFRHLLATALKGTYFISAVRPRDEEQITPETLVNGRRVEGNGVSVSSQFAKWGKTAMGEHISDLGKFAPSGYTFGTYVSYWTERLLDTPVGLESSRLESWNNELTGPSGSPIEMPEPRDEYSGDPEILAESVRPPTLGPFGFRGGWHLMSCGFHQLVPLIVQSGLLRSGDLLAIENPEVHLHPDLQIKVAEFLMEQSRAGKCYLIETHSDLIIQRLMRGVLEESIKQDSLGVYFTSVNTTTVPCSAQIKPLEVDRTGRIIANWPEGFMDAALTENQKLLDSIYESESQMDDDDHE